MTNDATSTSAPPATSAAARYSESLHVLIDEPTRAVVMGLAVLEALQAGPTVRPREGESIRTLLQGAIEDIQQRAPGLYARALEAGRIELKVREAAAKNARRGQKPRKARR
jgi:hypothetical protein